MTIKQKLLWSGVIALLLVFVASAVGIIGMTRTRDGATDVSAVASALRSQLESDLMRAALSGDVLAALREGRAGHKDMQSKLEAAAAEHLDRLTTRLKELAGNKQLPAEIQTEAETAVTTLTDYGAQAKALVTQSFTENYKANDLLAPFLKLSDDIAAQMGGLTEKLDEAARHTDAAVEQAYRGQLWRGWRLRRRCLDLGSLPAVDRALHCPAAGGNARCHGAPCRR